MMAAPVSGPRSTRRTRAEIEQLKNHLYFVVDEDKPVTVRQVFYQMVSRGLVPKSEASYNGVIGRLLRDMRRDGELPYRWIADNTRWMRKPTSYSDMATMLESSIDLYRRDLWQHQDAYVEVWLEKDALSGVLYPVTSRWDVPLMVTRGYPSLSFLHTAAEAIQEQDKPCYLYYLGDHDPSGVDIPNKVIDGLRDMAPEAEIQFEVLAVLPEQIEEFNLPTRPTKKSDTRAKTFVGESVEVDAIPPVTLRGIVEDAILRHVDGDRYERFQLVEEAERETLASFVSAWSRASL